MAHRERPADDPRGAGPAPAAWWASWRSALRLARRDIARHRGRAVLIVLLVGLPVLLISSLATAVATDEVSHVEALPRLMGQAQARVPLSSASHQQLQQDQYLQNSGELDGTGEQGAAALRAPGVAKDAPWTAERLQALTGGTVLSTSTAMAKATVGDRHVDAEVLGVDGREPASTGMVSLTNGHWPRSGTEVLVTPAGLAAGLPAEGTVTIDSGAGGDDARRVTVVGTGSGWASDASPADLVALPGALAGWGLQTDRDALLVVRERPVTWADVKELNRHGLLVLSRDVVEHPGQAANDVARTGYDTNTNATAALAVLLTVGIILETTLLAGPAFAVSAARQRRSLALIAANGARKSQLRRYVLAQAVLLGGVAAAAGAALGVGVGLLVDRAWQHTRWAMNAAGPVDVPVGQVLGIAAVAFLAALVAAYLPARGATRLDLVDVLRGRGVTQRTVHAGMPVVGLLIGALGGVLLTVNLVHHGREWGIALGGVVLFLGALLLVPWLLSTVGRVGGRFPLPLRIAVRDIGRQRGRSAPAVAAIMAAVTALTALAIGGFSDDEQSRQDYQPQAVMGEGFVAASGDGWVADLTARVHDVAPQLQTLPRRLVGVSELFNPGEASSARSAAAVRVQRHGCTPAQTVAFDGRLECQVLGSNLGTPHSDIRVLTPEQAAGLLRLDSTEQQVLADGGMLVIGGKDAISAGRVTVLTGSQRLDPEGFPTGRIRQATASAVPAQALPAYRFAEAFPAGRVGAVVAPATVQAQQWPTWVDRVELRAPDGAISTETQDALQQQLAQDEFLYVERGYRSEAFYVFLGLFVVFGLLVLVATLISTALAQAEARPDLATLAAVGAGRGLRRAVAAAQAFVVGLVGSLLGLVVGFVPGIAVTWPLTATGEQVVNGGVTIGSSGPIIVIPWLPLAAVVVGVPVLAALVAALGIRKAPEVTRRPG